MQRAVKIPRRACRFRRSREALVPRPMKIATSPIGSIATKTGIKARKNFSIIGGLSAFSLYRTNLLHNVRCLHSIKPFRMKNLCLSILSPAFALALAVALDLSAAETKSVDDFRAAAAKANAVLTIPEWEQTSEAVEASMKSAIAKANVALDQIGAQDPGKVTFKSTVAALDDVTYEASQAANKATIIKETNTSPAMRAAAEEAVKAFQEWAVGIDYREDVYKAIKAFADTHPKFSGEDEKLLNETLRDYRRAGLDLPPDQRKEVEQLRKELSKLGTDFDTNIVNAAAPVIFTKADLDGLPESFFASPGIKTGDDAYTVMANVTWQFNTVEENAKSEATRKQLYVIRETLAKDVNVSVLNQMLALRNKIALRLGYKSWDDFQTEVKMAKTGANAEKYINDLVTGIQPKFDSEVAELQKLKAVDTNDPNAKIEVWDWRYYSNQRNKQKYAVDKEALRAYFPFQKVLDGMFNIYQSIFGLKFEKVTAPYKWIDDLQLYLVTDSATGEPLGMFYLDMFPREGKFNHFAQFDIISGKLLPDGKYQRPTVALLCNFPPATADKPSLLTHTDVETLFHEFGHALHSIVTRAKYGRFAGTHVPGDFVEAPSQMLQNWVWDKRVLDAIAADMATVFEKAKDGYLDKQAGLRLRREIYEPGDSRDVNVSIEKFLGRKQSIQPFLKKIGIGPQEKAKAPAGPSQESR